MADFGTYSNSYTPFIPYNVLPEPRDIITWDWMETVSQFTRMFAKTATTIATLDNATVSCPLDWSSLNCEFGFPIVKTYQYNGTDGWCDNNTAFSFHSIGSTGGIMQVLPILSAPTPFLFIIHR